MLEFIVKYWLEFFFSGVLALLGAGYRKFNLKLKEQGKMKEGILAILHDRLYQVCRFYIHQGWIDVESMKNVEYLYDSYHDLGGNGTGTELYNRVNSLPIKED
ncbi:hypothetical protein [[Clostridium] scindens]|uniref:hypothetical protein n=1 Tax=Clostridium scindens (strain JCM 10418 / VPI 12708) TaxID=29347 RepID=UPI00298D0A89|nr:hypothetical protein [[Clostridium] scindens]WPB33890.1 hypothetical protein HCEICBPK_02663 [[Clostridium] scindens]